jgi:histidinol phosphatase-like PHP family hydrolase
LTDIAPFDAPGRFWRGNLHTHSTLSDGHLAPEQVVDAYKDAGYDFLMLSEHFIDHYSWPIADTRNMRSNRFTTIIGAELHAPETAVGELWHIVAAGLPLDFEPCEAHETGEQLARRACGSGAFVAIAHPSWSQLTMEDGRAIDCAHAVEIYNHGCAVENDRGEGWYLMDQLLNEGRRLTAIATDDAHFSYNSKDAFGGWVHVKAESLDPEAILSALKAGQFYSSQGPVIHELSIAGDELRIVTSPVETITVVCGTSRTATRNGRALTEVTLDLGKLREGWLLRAPSKWIRVTVIDAAGNRAWTNPIWLEEI